LASRIGEGALRFLIARPKEKFSSRRQELSWRAILLNDIVNRASHPNVCALQRSDERFRRIRTR
jgi:hypothetical protein